MNVKRKIESEKFKPETKIEKNIDDIKYYHMKNINSLDMTISAITLNKPYLSSDQPKADLVTWPLLNHLKNHCIHQNSQNMCTPLTLK